MGTHTCSIPGCQSHAHSRGWCRHHYDRWRGHSSGSMPRIVTPRHLAEMTDLADEDLSRFDIAAITGFSVQTVGRRIGHLVPARPRGRVVDVARYRRMIAAAKAAEYGTRDEIARRFGLKDRFSLNVMLVKARRAVALEEAVRREAGAVGGAA